jgi:hypothetical protein
MKVDPKSSGSAPPVQRCSQFLEWNAMHKFKG